MALQAQDREVKGAIYRVHQFKATKGLGMFLELAKMVGPSLGILVDGAAPGKDGKVDLASVMSMRISGDVFGKATEALFGRMDTARVQAMIAELAEQTYVNPEPSQGDKFVPLKSIYELHFAGKLGALFAWLKFALEVQFADFLSSLGTSALSESATPNASPAE